MIGLSCTAGAVLALCGQVRGTLERKGLPQKELDGGRVRIEPRYNQGSGFGLVPLNGRQMAPLSLAALWALLGVCGGRGLGAGLLLSPTTSIPIFPITWAFRMCWGRKCPKSTGLWRTVCSIPTGPI